MLFLLKNLCCSYKNCDGEACVLSLHDEHPGSSFEIYTNIKTPRKYIDKT